MGVPETGLPDILFYSSRSGNTARFVDRLGLAASRIPVEPDAPMPAPDRRFVLICPTYADGQGRGAVPKQVIRFLNAPENRALLVGVIASGNRNFGATYALAGRIISEKCNVPLLYRFELAGTETDITRVRAGLDRLGTEPCSMTA